MGHVATLLGHRDGEVAMAGRIEGRAAVVTGAGDGIGEGIARRFAAEGAKVLVAELNPDRGKAVAEQLADEFGADVRFVHTDVAVKDSVRAMIEAAREAWGTVDVLVNNAWGGGRLSPVAHQTDALFDPGFHLGVYGPFWAMQAV